MSTPDEARFDLRAWFHDSGEVCEHDTYGTDVVMPCAVMAEHLSAALAERGYAIVRSDELVGLRALRAAARAYQAAEWDIRIHDDEPVKTPEHSARVQAWRDADRELRSAEAHMRTLVGPARSALEGVSR
jgi:hypothetical protein